jgi:hypothetical protein
MAEVARPVNSERLHWRSFVADAVMVGVFSECYGRVSHETPAKCHLPSASQEEKLPWAKGGAGFAVAREDERRKCVTTAVVSATFARPGRLTEGVTQGEATETGGGVRLRCRRLASGHTA